MLEQLQGREFEIRLESHAAAILEKDFPEALSDIEGVLLRVEIPIREIIGSGGGETKGTQRIRRALAAEGWHKKNFEIKKIINGVERESISYEVDHAKEFDNKKVIALEIEWNNKDPFFDRDLENFKRLHAEGAISVGIIITRGPSLHSQMRDFVQKFAVQEKVGSFQDLQRIGLNPTPRQQRLIAERVSRQKNRLDLAIAWTDSFVADKYGEVEEPESN
jgi:Restriction endonuclease BglII